MGELLVTFATLNQVALLKRALYRKDIFVEMQRTPLCLADTGCAFALRIRHDQLCELKQECADLSIAPGGSYTLNAEGIWTSLQEAAAE